VAPEYGPVLAGVLRAFDPAQTDSRLLVTSRFTFTLDGLQTELEDVQLRPLSEVAQRKLLGREQALTPAPRLAERAALAARAVAVSRGNPGLQDLICLRLVFGEQVGLERAEAAVAGMEAYLAQGDLPADAEVRAFLENLALDALLAEAGTPDVALLRATTLFDLPVPDSVIGVLAGQVGGSVTRLRGLGLLGPYPDLYDPARPALAADPLAAGRIEPLSPGEQAALAAASARALFAVWGGAAPQPGRDLALDLQLAQLALLADDPAVAAACAAGAVTALRAGPATAALRLGQDAVGLLDRHGHPVPLTLLRQSADAALTSGDGQKGEALLDRAAQQVQAGEEHGVGPLDRARVITEQARRLIIRSEFEQADQLLRHAHQLFTAAGSEREAATAMGYFADIAYWRGDYDEALRIRREVELPVYDRLGDTRSAAVAWGKIADIAYQRGDYDEALRIHREVELPVYERLGDTRSTAVTWNEIAGIAYQRGDYDEAAELQRKVLEVNRQLGDLDGIATVSWDLAKIDLAREDDESALPRLMESFQIFGRLQRPDGIAAVGWALGQLLMAAGQTDLARRVLGDALAAATIVGWTDLAQQINELLKSAAAGNEKT
jgi:tetratricopeptide (TPR) repeat protein